MKKFFFIISIFSLILLTAIIKNSTKEIEDKIFVTKENLIVLENEFGNLNLEFNYLSSSEKLLNHQLIHFEKKLIKKELKEIKIIKKDDNNFKISDFEIYKNNEQKSK